MRPVIAFAGFVVLYLYSALGVACDSMPLPIMTVLLLASAIGMVGVYLRELLTPNEMRLPLPRASEAGRRLHACRLMGRTLVFMAVAEILLACAK